ncbi:MAG: hypothetical protein L0J35_05590 [Tetragenococcus halophilus]|nr:hypothetical protein [Tetragenococcus halophilus]
MDFTIKEATSDFTVKKEVSLEDFVAWSGGKYRLNEIIELDIVEEAEEYIQECIGTDVTETELNDFLWFSMDDFIEDFQEEEE